MSDDINLLPEDLRKSRTLKDREDFDINDIEYTAGEKLVEEKKQKPAIRNKMGSWFKPRPNVSKIKKSKNFDLTNSFALDLKDKIVDESENKSKNQELVNQKDKETEEIKTNNQSPDFARNRENKKIEEAKDEKIKTSLPLKLEKKKKKQKGKHRNVFDALLLNVKNLFQNKKKDKQKKEKEVDVNLLPFDANIPSTKKLYFSLLIALIISSIFTSIVFFGFYIYRSRIVNDYNKLDDEFETYIDYIKGYDDVIKEMEIWKNKISEISGLFDRHIYWTKFFKAIEDNTLPDIQYNSFAGSIEGNLTLNAVAPDYKTVARQWIHLNQAKDFIDMVIIDKASLATSGNDLVVSFSLTLDFIEDIFYKK